MVPFLLEKPPSWTSSCETIRGPYSLFSVSKDTWKDNLTKLNLDKRCNPDRRDSGTGIYQKEIKPCINV